MIGVVGARIAGGAAWTDGAEGNARKLKGIKSPINLPLRTVFASSAKQSASLQPR